MVSGKFVAAMYASYRGENSSVAGDLGKQLVTKGDVIVADSFLQDRPPPVVQEPLAPAEIRIGKKSNFVYDSTVDNPSRKDLTVQGPKYGPTKWPDPPPKEPDDDETDDYDTIVNVDFRESNRTIETIRVQGSDGESWVDIQRILSVTFPLPERQGPNGTIKEFWTYHFNWENPVINDVDTSDLNLGPGDTIIDVN
jgi:hypothetical protein